MGLLTIIYRVIIGILSLLTITNIVRSKSLDHAISMAIVMIPLVLRTLMIK